MSNYSEDPVKEKITKGITGWLLRPIPSTGARRVASTSVALSTDVGTQRKENQDRAIAGFIHIDDEPVLVLALADGMGGMAQGSRCAAIALAAFLAELATTAKSPITTRLTKAAHYADFCVHNEQHGNGGSTLSAVIIIRGQNPVTLNVGDSRIYSFFNSSILRLTKDDTIEEQFKDIIGSKIAESERHSLLQYIGMGSDLEPHVETIESLSDDFLITSDGVNFCGDENLLKIKKNSEPGTFVKRTTELSKWLGSNDNVTALVVDGISDTHERLTQTTEKNSIVIWDCFGERTEVIPEKTDEKSRRRQQSELEPQSRKPKPKPKPKSKPEKKKKIDSKKENTASEDERNEVEQEPKELQIEFFKGSQGE